MKNDALLALVLRALGTHPSLNNIRVAVNDGVVILSGVASDETSKALARTVVSGVPEVKSVTDHIQVEPLQPHRVGVRIDWARGNMALV